MRVWGGRNEKSCGQVSLTTLELTKLKVSTSDILRSFTMQISVVFFQKKERGIHKYGLPRWY